MKKIRKIASDVCRVASAVCMAASIALFGVGTYLSFCKAVA